MTAQLQRRSGRRYAGVVEEGLVPSRGRGPAPPLRRQASPLRVLIALCLIVGALGCGKEEPGNGPGGGGHGPGSGGSAMGGRPGDAGGGLGGGSAPAVPVEVAVVVRRSISSFIETNGTLEAENEVDLVARTSGPIVEMLVEEGDLVQQGRLLARIDDEEIRSQVDISEVALNEARLSFERAERLREGKLISPEEYEQAQTRFETAEAQLEGNRVLLGFTEIRAPFDGLIIVRYIDFAQQMSPNAPLFRLSDFDPLLCPIQIPERDLSKVRRGQPAYLTFEAWPGERFEASVLRISPVVDAGTGTVKVTLEVEAQGRLRPGMFARVFVETDTRPDTLVIPKAALSLESLGDTVYIAVDGKADRREVDLGFREGDFVEARSGVGEGERVVVVGQDGLSDGTPIRVLSDEETSPRDATQRVAAQPPAAAPGFGGGRPDFSQMTPEQLERAKEFMRARGLSEQEIEERIGRKSAPEGADGQ
jgi:membrane fusion protein (multidrug efflux system)